MLELIWLRLSIEFSLIVFLTKAKGIDLSGEKLLGLVDGAQAIVLTLLVIELPALIIEAMEHVGEACEHQLSIRSLYVLLVVLLSAWVLGAALRLSAELAS